MEIGFFDRASRGRLVVTGRDRVDLLHRLATNSLLGLQPGQGVSTCFCTNKGRLIDWAVVLGRGDDLLVLSGNPDRLSGHIQQYTITEDLAVRNYMAIEIAVCGPGARAFLGVDLPPWGSCEVQLGDVKVQVVRIEPLAGDGYAILAPDAVALRRLLAQQGTALAEADVARLRVRSGIPAVPNEINEDYNPWEAGLEEAISLQKGCYIGQEVIARLKTYDKIQRRLTRLRLDRPFAEGDPVLHAGEVVGRATTVAGDEALAYVRVEHRDPGTRLDGADVVAFG